MGKRSKPEGYIPRPPNHWIVYRAEKLKEVSTEAKLKQDDASRKISKMWSNEPLHVKQHYIDLAAEKLLRHKQLYPDYVYRPSQKDKTTPGAKAKKPRSTRGAELFSTMEDVPLALDTASEAAPPFSSMGALVAESPSSRSLNLMTFPSSADTTPEMPQAGNHFKPQPVALTTQAFHGPSTMGNFLAEPPGSQPVRRQWPNFMPNETVPVPQAQQQVNWYSQAVGVPSRMVPPAQYSYNNPAMQRVSNEASGLQGLQESLYQYNTNPATQQAEAQPFYAEPQFQNYSAIPQPQSVVIGTQTDAGRCPDIDFPSAESAGSSENDPFKLEFWNSFKELPFDNVNDNVFDIGYLSPGEATESTDNTYFELNVPPPNDNLEVRAGEFVRFELDDPSEWFVDKWPPA